MRPSIVDISALLTQQSLQAVYAHASECYPEEACGFVFSDSTVHTGTNIQTSLHHTEPQRYRRDARTAFTFSVKDLYLLATSFDSRNPVSIIYHSHPDVGAYFSDEDTDKALFMGQPIHPVMHLVVDVRKSMVEGALLFRWNGYQFEQCHSFFIPNINDKGPTKKVVPNEYV